MNILTPKLLLIQMDHEKAGKITAEVRNSFPHGTVISISAEEETTPLGALAGADGWMNLELMKNLPPAYPIEEEMMVICGFGEEDFDRLLKVLRRNGLNVSLKAVLTEQNAVWNARQLYGEISLEREYMTRKSR